MAYGFKSGGRRVGTPNKSNILKPLIGAHSLQYFTPDSSGKSQFDLDMDLLAPNERAPLEVKLLEFTTPRMKAVDADINITSQSTIEDRLAQLASTDPDD